ncbi:hypothetical protein NP493_173g02045 [Ridgeia piscesae]|uniref:Gamma-tubulin complex component 6 N-terminal domain-containing protein n=1 Tax=Ridgeia piscesae TaxID=27915 RepID=A0AAD9UF43_RIDPI|nr:hypothetical protein NP493_173g02045 [Ridgeia piscesae]
MEEEGYTALFSRLCDIHSQPDHPAIVYHQRLVRQRHKRRLKKTLYNALFQSMPSKPCNRHEGSQLTDLDEVYSRAYVMRCQRRFGDARNLEDLTEGFLSVSPVARP